MASPGPAVLAALRCLLFAAVFFSHGALAAAVAPNSTFVMGYLTVDAFPPKHWAFLLGESFRANLQVYYQPQNISVVMKVYDPVNVTVDAVAEDNVTILLALDNAAPTAFSLADALPSLNVSVLGWKGATASERERPNVAVVDVPLSLAGFEAGYLAGLIATRTRRVAVLTDGFFNMTYDGARIGVVRSCPSCTVLRYTLCSTLYRCGDYDRAYDIAASADVVILASVNFQFVTYVFTKLQSASRPTYTIITGRFFAPLAAPFSTSPLFVAQMVYSYRDLLQDILDAVDGVFRDGRRKVTFNWYPTNISQTNSSLNKEFLRQALTQFENLLSQVNQGVVVPIVTLAIDDSSFADVPPFSAYGYIVEGLPASAALPNIETDFNPCVNDDDNTIVLLHKSLTYVIIFDVKEAQFRTVPLDLPRASYLTLGIPSSYTITRADYTAERWLNASSAAPRVGMLCHYMHHAIGTTDILFEGGYTTTTDKTPLREVLRLRYMCLDPIISCDFLILDNITAGAYLTHNETIASRYDASAIDARTGLVTMVASHAGSAAVVDASRFTYPLASTVLLGDVDGAALSGLATAPHIRHLQWMEAYQAFVAVDIRHRRLVLLRNDTVVAAASRPSPFALWEILTDTLPPPLDDLNVAVDASLTCVFYIASLRRLAMIVQVRETQSGGATPLYIPKVYHFSSAARSWLFRSQFVGSVSKQPLICLAVPNLQGGGALLYPLSGAVSELLAVSYPTANLDCASTDQVYGEAVKACVFCSANEQRTADGFCQTSLLSEKSNAAVVVAAAICAAVVGLSLLIIAGVLFRRAYGAHGRSLTLAKKTRNPANAPSMGTSSVLVVNISDIDLLCSSGSSDVAAVSGEDSPIKFNHKRDGEFAVSPSDLRGIIDFFCESLSRSVVANACYLAEFRGDFAIVVSASASDLLCVAVEVSFAMASRELPIRLSCGLHYDWLACTKDPTMDRILYSGQAIRATTRIASMSKQGSIVASEAFEAQVGDAALKHLGILRGHSGHVRVVNTSVSVREFVLNAVTDLFPSVDVARERRQKVLRVKREKAQLHASPDARRKGRVGTHPPAPVVASSMDERGAHYDSTLPGASVVSNPLDAIQKRTVALPYSNNNHRDVTPTRQSGVDGVGRVVASADDAAGAPRPESSGDSNSTSAAYFARAPLICNERGFAVTTAEQEGPGGSPPDAAATLNLSNSKTAPADSRAAPIVPSATGGTSSNSLHNANDDNSSKTLKTQNSFVRTSYELKESSAKQYAALRHPSTASDQSQQQKVKGKRRLSSGRQDENDLTRHETEILQGLATGVARVLLTHLAAEPKAFDVVVRKHHLPVATASRRGSSATTLHHAALRSLAQRVVGMASVASEVQRLVEVVCEASADTQLGSSWWPDGSAGGGNGATPGPDIPEHGTPGHLGVDSDIATAPQEPSRDSACLGLDSSRRDGAVLAVEAAAKKQRCAAQLSPVIDESLIRAEHVASSMQESNRGVL